MQEYFSTKNLMKFLLLGFVVFLGLLFFGEYEKIFESVGQLSAETILILLALTSLSQIFRFFRWEYFLRKLNIEVERSLSAAIFFSGFSMGITPAKVGEVLKAQLLKDKAGIPRRNSIMVVFSERLADVIGVSILSLFGLSAFFLQAWGLLLIFGMIIVILFVLSNEKICLKLISFAEKLPRLGKFASFFRDSYTNSKILFAPTSLAASTAISIVSWSFECLALYVLLQAVGIDISLATATFIFSFSSIFGAVLVLPGGLGAAEGSFVALLLLAGAGKAAASLATIVIRITTLWFGVAIGLLSLAYVSKLKNFAPTGPETA